MRLLALCANQVARLVEHAQSTVASEPGIAG
jgi:hypothetical protein